MFTIVVDLITGNALRRYAMITRFAVLCLSLFATQVWASDKPFACDGTLSITNGEVRCVTTSTQESASSFYETKVITTVAKQLVTTYETQIPKECVMRVLRNRQNDHPCRLETHGFRVKEANVSFDGTENLENSHLPAIRITNKQWKWAWSKNGRSLLESSALSVIIALLLLLSINTEASVDVRVNIFIRSAVALVGSISVLLLIVALGTPILSLRSLLGTSLGFIGIFFWTSKWLSSEKTITESSETH